MRGQHEPKSITVIALLPNRHSIRPWMGRERLEEATRVLYIHAVSLRVAGKVLASTHLTRTAAVINTIIAALPSCLAGLISFRLTHSSTSHQQTKWFLLSSSTPASTCPRSASASGRSTAPSLPMSSTTLSRQATASSMVPVVCSRLPASNCTSHNTPCQHNVSPRMVNLSWCPFLF